MTAKGGTRAMKTLILLMQCPDRPGIVARITDLVMRSGGNITSLDQHTTDPVGGVFFMRIVFTLDPARTAPEAFEDAWRPHAEELTANYEIYDQAAPLRMGILVSKQTHCLADLLYRYSARGLNGHIALVVSNHPDAQSIAASYGIAFEHVPVARETKIEAERRMLELLRESTDLLVLARYMQVLTDGFLSAYGKPVINIHHSFLPAFKGASPYRQAYERGVKVIGATAHYVTAELDEGPIIEQLTTPTYYKDTPDTLRQKGANLETMTLANAVQAHLQHRIILYQHRTVVFP